MSGRGWAPAARVEGEMVMILAPRRRRGRPRDGWGAMVTAAGARRQVEGLWWPEGDGGSDDDDEEEGGIPAGS